MGIETSDIYIPQPIDRRDLGYLAGLIDGEGYFMTGSVRFPWAIGLRVSMIDGCVIDWLHARFAGAVNRAGKTTSGNRVHVWALTRKADLRFLMPQLEPVLVLKAAQARALIALIAHNDGHPAKTYVIPTSQTSGNERCRREALLADWRDEREQLRLTLKKARRTPHFPELSPFTD